VQVLVIYYSRTGNTKKLARAISEGVESIDNVNCLLKSVDLVSREDFISSEGIIAGSPVYFGTMAAEMKKVFDDFIDIRKKMENKIGAAFATSADPSGGKETTVLSILQAMLIYGMVIIGDPLEATGHYGVACKGSPGDEDRVNAHKLGKRVAQLVKRIHG
jgi:NAD(P)H dehydrogenase (quinone)